MKPRIFISSIMPAEFRPLRDAAHRAITRGGYEAVRAENHPASPISPHTACLDMVASADGVVLILGPKYGNVTETGHSATEDEYREAVRLKKRVFVFLQTDAGEFESQQKQFVTSITGYIGDNWRKTFSTLVELEKLVLQSLREDVGLTMAPDAQQLATDRIGNTLGQSVPKNNNGVVWLQNVWSPMRDEDVIRATELVKPQFEDMVFDLGLQGDNRLFSYTTAKKPDANSTRLRIEQLGSEGARTGNDLVTVDFFRTGTLSVMANVTRMHEQDRLNLMGSVGYYIDPDDVRVRLTQAWDFAAKLWQRLDEFGRYNDMLYNAAIHELGFHALGKAPQGRNTSFTIRTMNPPELMTIHEKPKRIVRADLLNPGAEVEETMDMLTLRLHELG